jgi:FkbM family methyltransferase
LFRFFDDECIVNVLDVGASMGDVVSYQRLVDAGRARVTGFEPDEASCQRLRSTYGASHRFFPLFLGDGREATFYETNNSYTGSLFEPNTPLLGKFWELESLTRLVAEHRVATTRLDDVADLGEVDFIKIDVQGAELAIFSNARKALNQALAIQTEVSFVESYKNQSMFSDVDAFLRAHGFQYHRILGFGSRPFLPLLNPNRQMRDFNQHIWADAFYVKDWMHLENFSDGQLKKYAGILHDVLRSFDLAHLALAELDRRTGQTMADAYRRRLVRDGEAISVHGPERTPRPNSSREVQAATVPAESANAVAVPKTAASDSLVLETGDGIAVSVPATLDCITTYVLLEQEHWFEKETPFVARYLTEGMTAIDIGANLGVYSLPMAKAVGPGGRVYAYEPGSANRRHLEASAALNCLASLQILPLALSDRPRQGWLRLANSGELNSIVNSANAGTECVEISSLDAQAQQLGWTKSVDFIKIDAEGQEAKIVAGGRDFFHRFSPVVLYEIRHTSSNNETLRWMFEALGYGAYRLSGDGSFLVPVGADEPPDEFEPNMFAIKPDRVKEIAARGLLAPAAREFVLTDEERSRVVAGISSQAYSQAFGISLADIDDCPFVEGLTAYGAFLFLDGLGLERRYSALAQALSRLERYCAESPSPAALSTLVRVAIDSGSCAKAVSALRKIVAAQHVEIDQPFFPAAPRFDSIRPQGDEAAWFMAAVLEQLEILEEHSSMFADNLSRLSWLCAEPTVSDAMLRRLILVADRLGTPRREVGKWLARLQARQTRNLHVWRQDIGRLMEMFGA